MLWQRLAIFAFLFASVLAAGIGKKLYPKATVTRGSQYSAFGVPLSDAACIQQALERLTFGSTPGQSSEANGLGLRKWIDLQLHPEKIAENPELGTKLAPYESLKMSAHEIYLHYPPPQLIAAVARGRQAPPADPDLREVVDHMVNRYLRKQQAKDGDQANAGKDDADLESKTPLTSLLDSSQIETLRHGKPEGKRAVLASIPAAKQLEFAYALRAGERRALLPLAPVPLQRMLLLSLAPPQAVLNDLASAKILRAAYSNRQLQEELVDFWFNHFNVFYDKGADRYLLTEYERDAIRPHVFGKFYDLLLATAQSPAMLTYLDNAQSVSPAPYQIVNARPAFGRYGPLQPPRVVRVPPPPQQIQRKRGLNENYGRELMELHTLGVNGGYAQKDVIEVARCFTVWTVAPPKRGSRFEFNPKIHDFGQKMVLGHTIPPGGGMEDGIAVLKMLASSPQTARHISLELAERFVADDPPPSLVSRMTTTYLNTKGDLREVVRTMILSPEFFSKGAYHAKVKSPFEMIVSAVRATNADVDSPWALTQQITQLGEPLYRKIEPTGYSNANSEWVSTASLVSRMNFSLALVNNRIQGVHVNQDRWSGAATGNPLVLARLLLDGDPTPATQNAVQKAVSDAGLRAKLAQSARLSAPTVSELVAGLVLGSPEFQRR